MLVCYSALPWIPGLLSLELNRQSIYCGGYAFLTIWTQSNVTIYYTAGSKHDISLARIFSNQVFTFWNSMNEKKIIFKNKVIQN